MNKFNLKKSCKSKNYHSYLSLFHIERKTKELEDIKEPEYLPAVSYSKKIPIFGADGHDFFINLDDDSEKTIKHLKEKLRKKYPEFHYFYYQYDAPTRYSESSFQLYGKKRLTRKEVERKNEYLKDDYERNKNESIAETRDIINLKKKYLTHLDDFVLIFLENEISPEFLSYEKNVQVNRFSFSFREFYKLKTNVTKAFVNINNNMNNNDILTLYYEEFIEPNIEKALSYKREKDLLLSVHEHLKLLSAKDKKLNAIDLFLEIANSTQASDELVREIGKIKSGIQETP